MIWPRRDVTSRKPQFLKEPIGSHIKSPWLLSCSPTAGFIFIPELPGPFMANNTEEWGDDWRNWSLVCTPRLLFNSSGVRKRARLRTWKSHIHLKISKVFPRFNLKELTQMFKARINHKRLSWGLEEWKKLLYIHIYVYVYKYMYIYSISWEYPNLGFWILNIIDFS